MRAVLKYFQHNVPLLLVIAVAVFICGVNYAPGTWLSGWDTLHPEFNLGLYTQRVVFGAWQEHQGLGAPASQAHLAELPRLPILFILQLLLPDSLVRYSFFFLMYITGGIGTYVFIKESWFAKRQTKYDSWLAGVGALFFLLNLGTLQHFYVPLEMFAVHFATIGFVLWSIDRCIKQPTVRNLGLFFVIQIFTAPSAHTATLFYGYMVIVGVYTALLTFFTYQRKMLKGIQILLTLALLVIAAHSYWIFPNLYYVITHNDYVSEAKISRNFSPEAFWQNQAFGDVTDVIIFKNFLFNWKDYNYASDAFVDLFDEWRHHLQRGGYVLLFIISFLALYGLFSSRKSSNKALATALFSLWLMALFFLVNLNFPFAFLYQQLLKVSLLQEALRFPFTKFSILLILAMSVYLSQGLSTALIVLHKRIKVSPLILASAITVLSTAAILCANLPALQGNLISSNMKVTFPSEYAELYDWLDQQPQQSRIVKFPITTYWGWVYHNWGEENGYQGAGFTWFGIPQPTMDREFDRWANTNEFFYQELSSALQLNQREIIPEIFTKYDISYLLLDRSSLNTEKKDPNQDTLIANEVISQFGFKKVWESGNLAVYSTKTTPSTSFVSAPSTFHEVVADTSNNRNDTLYRSVGNYIATPSNVMPWTLFQKQRINNLSIANSDIQFNYSLPSTLTGNSFSLRQPTKPWITLPVTLLYDGQQLKVSFPYTFSASLGGNSYQLPHLDPFTISYPEVTTNLVVSFGTNQFILQPNRVVSTAVTLNTSEPLSVSLFDQSKVITTNGILSVDQEDVTTTVINNDFSNVFSYQIPLSSITANDTLSLRLAIPPISTGIPHNEAVNCDPEVRGYVRENVLSDQISVRYLADRNAVNCESIRLPLQNRQSYLLKIVGENLKGRSLKVVLRDEVSGSIVMEELLPEGAFNEVFTVVTPDSDAFLYTLSWETRSFGHKSENILQSIELYPFPIEYFSNHIITADSAPPAYSNTLKLTALRKIGSYQYVASVENTSSKGLLVLSQTYDPLWIAFNPQKPFSSFEHVKFNGWANGWIITEGKQQVVIIYLPQLAAFLGLFGLIVTSVVLAAKSKSNTSVHLHSRHQPVQLKHSLRSKLSGKK